MEQPAEPAAEQPAEPEAVEPAAAAVPDSAAAGFGALADTEAVQEVTGDSPAADAAAEVPAEALPPAKVCSSSACCWGASCCGRACASVCCLSCAAAGLWERCACLVPPGRRPAALHLAHLPRVQGTPRCVVQSWLGVQAGKKDKKASAAAAFDALLDEAPAPEPGENGHVTDAEAPAPIQNGHAGQLSRAQYAASSTRKLIGPAQSLL